MIADATPMNANKAKGMIDFVPITTTIDSLTEPSLIICSSAIIGVASAIIGVSQDFR